jgi:hypothetical protein
MSNFRKNIFVFIFCLVVGFAAGKALACSAYLDYEYTEGMSRVCVYNHLGTRVPYVISSASMCPLSLEIPHD